MNFLNDLHGQTMAPQPADGLRDIGGAGASTKLPDGIATAARLALVRESLPLAASPDEQRAASYRALAFACRSYLLQRWARTQRRDAIAVGEGGTRRVHYLSMEFLLGRALNNALAALGATGTLEQWLAEQGMHLSDVLEQEPDAALGNGGLGRLAACFLDAMAEAGLPAFGYGLRYEFGMFAQRIEHGQQVEIPEDWLRDGSAWEKHRPQLSYTVGFGGSVEPLPDGVGRHWIPAEEVQANAVDLIIPAHNHDAVVTLRQWQARAREPLDFALFCRGEHHAAARQRLNAEMLNWVLYPDDSTEAGRELRLKQEAFLVSASVQDLIARHLAEGQPLSLLGQQNCVHLNDTHPALAVIELLHQLIDRHGMSFAEAWRITRQAVSYTNHTLLPEALESWPVGMVERLLPRHLELVFAVNAHFLADVRARFPGDEELVRRVSLIDDDHGHRRVRMAGIAIVASHKVNGVAALHSKLMVQTIFADYAKLFPERFYNVTNGVTPRRWLMQANTGLAGLLDHTIGTGWRRDLTQLTGLASHADDPEIQRAFLAIKHAQKRRLAVRVGRELGVKVDPNSLFDVQIKRIHEYKRQLLNLLHVVARHQAMLAHPEGIDGRGWTPRTIIIAGKAASAYRTAKQIIQLALDIARVINRDPRTSGRLKLLFLPNYGVSLAERIIPATDLSEQISTAGTEASGTGNMKFAMNGALTIGTWDGATIEMAEAIGPELMFIFGHRVEELEALRKAGDDPSRYVAANPRLKRVLEVIRDGGYSPDQPGRHRGLVDALLRHDHYFLLADFEPYLAAQAAADQLFRNPRRWSATALRNIAAMGSFSVDRAIADYRTQVWSPEALAASGLV
jgi:starch phosphorylase